MTKQEAFDKVWEYFIVEEGKPGFREHILDKGPGCQYRTKDGGRCAIGVLIPDNIYEHYFEQAGPVAELMNRVSVIGTLLSGLTIFCEKLQTAHDLCPRSENDNFKSWMKTRLEALSASEGLIIPV